MSFWGRNWWVGVICLFVICLHFNFSKEKKQTLLTLNHRLQEMEQKKLQVLDKKEDLELRIASQNDPAWVEMILIQELGVVPEGFLKVHFKK